MPASASIAACMSRAETTRDDLARRPGRAARRSRRPAVTCAPRGAAERGERVALLAGRPVAQEADRVEFLARPAGRDHHAPARQRQVAAAASAAQRRRGGRARSAWTTANSSAGSGSRPLPVSAPVSRPDGRVDHDRAALAQRAPRCAVVAGCSHISVCMAGASTTGQRAVSKRGGQQVAGHARGGAGEQVGGRGGDDDQVGASGPAGRAAPRRRAVQTSVATGSPDRAAHVGSPTNRSASAVGMTRTPMARLAQQAQQAQPPCRRRFRRRRQG